MERVQALFGIFVIFAIAWLLSENRRAARPSVALIAIGLQVAIAGLLLHVPLVKSALLLANDAVLALQAATEAGTSLVFGYLGGAALPFDEPYPGAAYILAFRGLPLLILVSALAALLLYWGLLQRIIRGFAALLERSFGVGGPVGFVASANVFFGMVEAPLFARGYLERLDRGELFMVMAVGMATIAGTMLALYVTILGPVLPNAAGHLITASLISVPAALAIATLMVPREGSPTQARVEVVSEASGSMDAIVRGTQSGLKIFLSVLAMLLVMIGLVHLVDAVLGLLPEVADTPLSLGRLFGWIFSPLVWLIGIPWEEAAEAGRLMGVKTALNELVAYLELAKLPEEALSERSRLIMTYALCGFANFGSLGIMIAGLATLAPERRAEIAGLGLKSIVAGTLATLSTGAVVGLF
ncbi:NupC/NupG family nucleoside CNT transporter [Algihabitans albus]|uniref:NupC/NupG family nucleoside CNT transporter n=1 Tax=Algihabitans albus TaxID=2164067 RepID=UPI000E5C8A80|nr:nucleoside transporter C-terminal domain-containing protein [Algihabitans albus]